MVFRLAKPAQTSRVESHDSVSGKNSSSYKMRKKKLSNKKRKINRWASIKSYEDIVKESDDGEGTPLQSIKAIKDF